MAGRHKPKVPVAKASLIQRTLPARSVRRVVAVFVSLLAVLLTVTNFSGDWAAWTWITSGIAATAGAGARLFGIPATVAGNTILLPSRSLLVEPQCTAATLAVVYTALVVAYPVSWKKRLIALAIGLPLLQVANILRLIGVAYASQLLAGDAFYIVHDYLFEFGMMLVVFVMWAVWLSNARTSA